MKKKDAINIIYPKVSNILENRKHLISLVEMQKEKEQTISLSDADLLKQIKYVIHNSHGDNKDFRLYLKEEMPHDTEIYELFVKPVTKGTDGTNLMYLVCAIRYVLLEKQPAKVVMSRKIFQQFTDVFLQIAENFNLEAQWWIGDPSGLKFE